MPKLPHDYLFPQNVDPNDPEVSEFLKTVKLVKYRKGEIILRPYDDPPYIYAIQAGYVKLYSIDSKGEQNILVIYGPGDIFPFSWIIDKVRPSVYYQAISPCEVTLLPQEVFNSRVKSTVDISIAVMRKILQQFYVISSRLNNLELKYARERLAYRLLMLAARFGSTIILPHITQQDLAGTINMTRENVSREISRLQKLRVIDYGRNAIIIHNPDALRKELGKGVKVMLYDEE
jgi:CRP-like cAMP-binding protein